MAHRQPKSLLNDSDSHMNRTHLWLVVAAILVIGLVLYHSRSGRNLDVDPHAREEIEKAKRR